MGKNLLCASALVGAVLSSGICFAKDPSVKKLKKAPTRIAVGGAILTLEAHLWKDSESASLAAALKMKTTGNVALPAGIEVNRVWVIRKKEVWSADDHRAEIALTEPGKPRSVMNIAFGNGPKWIPGTKVTCVVRIKMLDGAEGLLKAGKTAIAATP
ncbi:hypothetical protein ACFL6C_11680 [Myxococcota bacterium]